ncbi:hypothetical protein EYF80_001415 [Liparis tanakae]|uniref:Uncharacterized protein n=1 Tax=Liparis tanakae TaxID=230148 RepID=A0A4Z2JD92_9TELE|nr:hypothetical protein EYF80_001415 [Liparis tanakae]
MRSCGLSAPLSPGLMSGSGCKRLSGVPQLCSSLSLGASAGAVKTPSCSFLMCFFRSKLRQKPLPQVPQVKGFLSLCVCMWKVRL